MVYESVKLHEPLSQGDILADCPTFGFDPAEPYSGLEADPERWELPVVVLTQACDLAETKTSRILVATIHDAEEIVKAGAVKASVVRNDIRRGRVYGWYFLPACQQPIALPESLVDLRDLHTVPRAMLEELAQTGKRIGRTTTPTASTSPSISP